MYLEESQRRLGQEPQSLVSAADEERRALEYVQAAVSRPFACWLWRRKAIDRAIEAYLDLVAANSIKLDETLAASQAVIVLQSVMKDLHALEREIDLGISMLEKIRSELEREEQRRSHGQNLPILDMPGFQQLKDELLRTASAETLIGEFGWQTKDELYESIFASHEQERVLEGLVASAARLFDGQNLPSPMDLFLRQQTPEQLALLFNQLATMAQPQMRWRFPQHHESLPMPVEASCWAGVPQSINEQRGFVEAIQQMLHDQLDAGFRHQVTVISLSDPDRVAVLRDCEGFSLPVVAAVHACKADYKKSLLSKNDFHPHTRTDVEWQPILAETESPASARRPESIRSVAELRVRDCLLKVSVDDIVEMDVNSIVCSRSRTLEPGTASTRSVHGAIQQAGGGGIDQEAIRGGPIEHGAIIVTQAGALRADHVIHAGIIDDLTNQRVTQTVIARAVRASLNECEKREWTSIALPLMGTRVGGISQDKCVEVMLDEVYSHAAQGRAFPKVVVFCLQGFVGLARLVEKLTVLRERAAQIPARQDQSLVFISAKSEDYEYAEELFEYLVAVGVPTFFSKESLPKLGDADYRREIDRALEAAEHMVVVTTCRRHLESPWVEAEWGFFINEKRSGRKNGNLVTLTVGTLQPQELPPSLRYYEAIPSGPDAFTRIFQYIN
jgi:O-acetyl-ADP-ribose deacetylase (regulator of RNase III)